jgi:hypothetical protein
LDTVLVRAALRCPGLTGAGGTGRSKTPTSPAGMWQAGDRCLLLSCSHVAHDCRLGDDVVMSSDSKLAGQVEVGRNAIISARTGVAQFVRIGEFAFMGGFNKVTKDVLPDCLAGGLRRPSARSTGRSRTQWVSSRPGRGGCRKRAGLKGRCGALESWRPDTPPQGNATPGRSIDRIRRRYGAPEARRTTAAPGYA